MLDIRYKNIPKYEENFPIQVEGEGDDQRYSLHPTTLTLGFGAMAVELGAITTENVDEWMYRMAEVAKTHDRAQSITRDEVAAHIGLTVNVTAASRAEFDDHQDITRIENTGSFPGIWQHIRRAVPRAGEPCDIYVELSRRHNRSERRRIEAYRDGTLRTYEDGYNSIEGDNFDDGMGDPLPVINERRGVEAQIISEDDFEKLYERAHASTCRWEIGGHGPHLCGQPKETEDAAWCPAHKDAIAANLPRVSG